MSRSDESALMTITERHSLVEIYHQFRHSPSRPTMVTIFFPNYTKTYHYKRSLTEAAASTTVLPINKSLTTQLQPTRQRNRSSRGQLSKFFHNLNIFRYYYNVADFSRDCLIKYVAENSVKFSCKTARATVS